MTTPLLGKRILLGITGSIAAYKAADLCSRLGKLGADVTVVMTSHARGFIGEATFQALTRKPVLVDVFDEPISGRIAHIDLAQSADIVVVAPATANTLAKLAHGLADDMLSTCLLATPHATPILVAPAMNPVMWENRATVDNLRILTARGVDVVSPGYGLLACQDVGTGRLAEVDDIETRIVQLLTQKKDYLNQNVLITAGATREPLDPVRFLSNRSSGKMGYALAEEAVARGAQVTLISGFTSVEGISGVNLVRIETAAQMLAACQKHFEACNLFIAAAAVADFAPAAVASTKIKKVPGEEQHVLELVKTPDILGTVAASKRHDQFVVGFAAETEDLIKNATVKLTGKNLDMIVANDVTIAGAGFDTDTNIVTVLQPDREPVALPRMPKREVSRHIFDLIAPRLPGPDTGQ